jgi:hypothetical protein
MSRRRFSQRVALVLLAAAAALLLMAAGWAQTTSYELTWWSVVGGGGAGTGGSYSLGGTVGQPDAGGLTGSGYELAGGVWNIPWPADVFLPFIRK